MRFPPRIKNTYIHTYKQTNKHRKRKTSRWLRPYVFNIGQKLLKGQINQNFDISSFNPIYLVCVDLVSNKHILKFQVNWTQDRRDNGTWKVLLFGLHNRRVVGKVVGELSEITLVTSLLASWKIAGIRSVRTWAEIMVFCAVMRVK